MSQSNYYSPKSPPTSVSCCSSVSAELKLYQAFIFSVPIFFTFILLFFFYLFYLRRRRADWSSLRMRSARLATINNNISACELGLKKEVREMLPIIVFKESFSVKDTQCSVCLGDYQAEDKLQQIPVCGHTFHMECIDLWLATHTTCPLCRLSLLASRVSDEPTDNQANETVQSPESPDVDNHNESSPQSSYQPSEDPQVNVQISNVDHQTNETYQSPESANAVNHNEVSPRCSLQPSEDHQLNEQISNVDHQTNETYQSPESADVENHDEVSPQCSLQPSEDPQLNEQISNIVHQEESDLELAVECKK